MSPNYNLRRFASLSFGILIATVAVGCQSTGNPMGMFGAAQQEQFRNPTKTHLAFAKLSEKTGDVQAARNSYQKVLEENPQSVAATIGMAGLELRCGRSDAAEREFLKASSLSPGDPLVTEALGQFYLSEHRYDEAEHYLTEGLQASPGNLHLQYRLGVALAHQGRLDE
ncbi:MAG: tetratricopeptide repeat protein, partial [Planctomycetaceae bacterium]